MLENNKTKYTLENQTQQIIADFSIESAFPVYIWGYIVWKNATANGNEQINGVLLEDEKWELPIYNALPQRVKDAFPTDIQLTIQKYASKDDVDKATKSLDTCPEVFVEAYDDVPSKAASVRVWGKAESIYLNYHSYHPKLYELSIENLSCAPNMKAIIDTIVALFKKSNPQAYRTGAIYVTLERISDPRYKEFIPVKLDYRKAKDDLFRKYSRTFRKRHTAIK